MSEVLQTLGKRDN